MIKLLHTGDWHIGKASQIPINRQVKNVTSPVNIRIIDTYKKIKLMVNYAIDKNINYFVIAGDIYDSPMASMYLKKWFAKYIRKLLNHNIEVIIIIGNHDSDGNINAFSDVKELVKNSKGLYIYDRYQTFETSKIKFHCIPYISDLNYIKHIKDVREDINLLKFNVLIGHFGIEGAVVGTKQIPLTADVRTNLLKGYDYVAMGDYHINQHVGDAKTRKSNDIWYSGSIIRLNMGEPEKKYFNVVTFTKKEKVKVTRVPLPDRSFVTKRTTLTLIEKAIRTKRIELPISKGDVIRFKCEATPLDAMRVEEKYIKLIYKKFDPIYAAIDWNYINTGKGKTVGYDNDLDPIKAFELYLRKSNTNLNIKELEKLHKMIVKKYGEN